MAKQIELVLDELPEFEGTRPAGTRLKINGLAPQQTSALHKGQRLVLLVVGEVNAIQFSDDAKRGLIRVHTIGMKEAYPLAEGALDGQLEDLRLAHKVAMDKLVGQTSTDDPPTDEELAEEEARLAREEAEREQWGSNPPPADAKRPKGAPS